MTVELKSYLKGEWVSGEGEGAKLVNPKNGQTVATASTVGLDFAGAFQCARDRGGPALRAMTFAQRGALLKQLSEAVHGAREELIEASIENAGTTRSDAKFDIDGAAATLGEYARLGEELGDKTFLVDGEGEQLTRSARFYGYHLKTPTHGVAVHVNAFNFPAWGTAEKLAVSLLAGVAAITKPATSTALLAFRLMETLVKCDALPAGSVQFVGGGAGDLLSHLGKGDVLAFTGGASTGRKLRGLDNVVAENVRVNIEADSLNATMLGADVEPGSELWACFVRHVRTEMTQKAGQKCTATRRIFAPAAHMDRLQEDLIEALSETKVGDPAADGVRVGPLATAQQLDDAKAGVKTLLDAGAKVVFGSADGKADLIGDDVDKGFFFGPALLRCDDPAGAPAVHEHEVFAPVSTLLPYENTDQAIEWVARGGGGLVCSIYTDDKEALKSAVVGLAPHHGRLLTVSSKTVETTIAPGLVLPGCVHGGPGRAGGGEELGGLRGMDLYFQRTAVQGDRGMLERLLGLR